MNAKPGMAHSMRCCLLLSGGIDSALVAYLLKSQGISTDALWIDYGQPAAEAERSASRAIARHYELEWSNLSIRGLALPTKGEIPGRNDLLVAAAKARGPGKSIAMGIHSGTNYADCSEEWVKGWQNLVDIQHSGTSALLIPLLSMDKGEVIAVARESRVPLKLTYSCESGVIPCNRCLSCIDRRSYHVGA